MKEYMTGKERIMAALRKEEVDRVPVVPLIQPYSIYGMDESVPHDMIELQQAQGWDVWIHLMADAGVIRVPKPDSGIRTFTRWEKGDKISGIETPVGTIWERTHNGGDGTLSVAMKHLLEEVEDMEVYLYYLKNTIPYRYVNKAYYDFQKAKVGETGIFAEMSQKDTPLGDMLNFLSGIDHTYELMAEDEDIFEELVDVMQQTKVEAYELLCEVSQAEVIGQAENLSWTTVSPALTEKYIIPHLNQYTEVAHKHGKLHIVHMCGKLKLLEKQLLKGVFDAITDIAPGPTGDTFLWEAAEMYPHVAVKGGIACQEFRDEDPTAVYRAAMEILERTEGRKGVLLGSGDSVPTTTWEHLCQIRRAVDDYYA